MSRRPGLLEPDVCRPECRSSWIGGRSPPCRAQSQASAGSVHGTAFATFVRVLTVAVGINPEGVIVGQFSLTNGGLPRGFAAVPAGR